MHHISIHSKHLSKIVLKLLDNEDKMYGYVLTQQYKSITEGTVKESALYPILHFLEADGFLITETEDVGNRIRKYYSLSPKARMYQKKEAGNI